MSGVDFFAGLPAADPYPLYRELREREPVHRTARGWVITRHADAMRVLRDPRFGRRGFDAIVGKAFGTPEPDVGTSMLFLDPPDHTRLRGLVSTAFTPRAVAGMRAGVAEMVDELLDVAEAAGRVDLIGDFAYPLAIRVICRMLGVPAADWRAFQRWSFDFARVLDNVGLTPDPAVSERGSTARRGLTEYFRDGLIPERRRAPRDDLVSGLIAAEAEGDKLTGAELLATCNFMMVAGNETTVNLLGNGIFSLLKAPEPLAALRERPDLIGGAVEELLRYESPVQQATRAALAEVRLDEATIAPGEIAFVIIGAANRDPARFPRPDRLDITRQGQEHLAFGWGIHFCLGAALARLEAQVAIPALLRRFPRLRLVDSHGDWRPSITLRGLRTLPLIIE